MLSQELDIKSDLEQQQDGHHQSGILFDQARGYWETNVQGLEAWLHCWLIPALPC